LGDQIADGSQGSVGELSNNLEGAEWGAPGLSAEDHVKKFNISGKLFKLRYLCKYHL